jgi:hypothetical protein
MSSVNEPWELQISPPDFVKKKAFGSCAQRSIAEGPALLHTFDALV